jgi:DNA invertase Pin-like site-specific DNA recombinase
MPDKDNPEAILYAAKSTEDKRGSIRTQLEQARAMAEGEGSVVVAEYSDEDASAYHGNRGPELEAALDHAERIGAALFVQHSDRLARGDGVKARHLVQLVFDAKVRGIRLRSVEDDSSLENVVMAAVMGERNTEDSRRKGAAVKAGMDRRRKRGQYIGHGFYGSEWFRNAEDEREIRISMEATSILERIFAEVLAGTSLRAISRNLEADGVPTDKGGRWYQGTVQKIVANPAYAGLMRDGEELIEARHDGVIPVETWRQAQRLLAAKARTHGRGRGVAGLHLFRKGFLRCGRCDGPMIPRTSREASGLAYETYLCENRERDRSACEMAPVKRADIDGKVFAYFSQVGLDLEATRERIEAACDRKLAESRSLLAAAESEPHGAAARLAKIRRDYTHGELEAAEWRELRDELEPELQAAEAEVERLRDQLAGAEQQAAVNDIEAAVVERISRIRASVAGEVKDADGAAAVRATLMRLFDGFTLREGIPEGSGPVNVELIGERWLEPHISAEAIKGFDSELPVLAKQPLETAGNNSYEGLTT